MGRIMVGMVVGIGSMYGSGFSTSCFSFFPLLVNWIGME